MKKSSCGFGIVFLVALIFWIVVGVTVCSGAEYTVTAYCGCEKCCGKWAKAHKTADGHTPKQGVTCAASRSIPFGTQLNIAGVGVRTVQDRLATKYDSRIDIYFDNHLDALRFGKRTLTVVPLPRKVP